jgi:hypothetical protein
MEGSGMKGVYKEKSEKEEKTEGKEKWRRIRMRNITKLEYYTSASCCIESSLFVVPFRL